MFDRGLTAASFRRRKLPSDGQSSFREFSKGPCSDRPSGGAQTGRRSDEIQAPILPVMGGWGRVLCVGVARPLLLDRLFHPWSVMAERMRVMNVSE